MTKYPALGKLPVTFFEVPFVPYGYANRDEFIGGVVVNEDLSVPLRMDIWFHPKKDSYTAV